MSDMKNKLKAKLDATARAAKDAASKMGDQSKSAAPKAGEDLKTGAKKLKSM
ncbi:MAG: hypothetical protein K2X03_26310 [Bryobacteraceae bacterium]|nr:hypothetical protein [Bryobacteraceae bacterium]